jgi:hypothetical protein
MPTPPLSCRRRQIWACPRSPEVFGLWYIAVMAMEIDLFEIDLAAGKFWLDLAREEKLRKRRDEIRLKRRLRRQTLQSLKSLLIAALDQDRS